MRRSGLAIPLLLLMSSSSWAAGVDLSWNDCLLGSSTATTNRNFSCLGNVDQTYPLFVQFTSAQAIPNFAAMTLFADVAAQAQGFLVPYWHYETGGCNQTGLGIADEIPASCQSRGYQDLWGGDGSGGLAAIAAYGPDYARPGAGRLVAFVARADAVPLQASVHYYGFHLNFRNNNRHNCFGCTQLAVVIAETLVLENEDGSITINLSGADNGTDCVGINGANPSLCGALPVANLTWGALKSLYK